jgi:hypothetical protein
MLPSLGQFARPLVELLLEIRRGGAAARTCRHFTALRPRCLFLAARLHLVARHPLHRPSMPTIDESGRTAAYPKFTEAAGQALLFDHLVGAGEQRWRDLQTQPFRRCDVYDQLKLCRQLDWQIARLRAFDNSTDVNAGSAIRIGRTASVAHQTAHLDEFAQIVDREHRVARRESDKLTALAVEKSASSDQNAAHACLGHRQK